MSRGHFIGLSHHRLMLLDELRMTAFQAAIREAVRPGDVVVDLGTGTGILALWAAQAGARRVYAIEPAPIIGVARQIAQSNPDGDRIVFIEADARTVTLPESADVLVSECMGNFFVTDDLSPVLRDAARFVRPGGRVIPGQLRLWLAPVFYPLLDDVTFWEGPVHGLDLRAARWYSLRVTYVRHLDPKMVMSPPQEFDRFDLWRAPDVLSGAMTFPFERQSTIHAVAGWFDARLSEGVSLSTGPGNDTHWAQLLFPIEPVVVPAGGRLDVTLELVLHDDYRTRWQWMGRVVVPDGMERPRWIAGTAGRLDDPRGLGVSRWSDGDRIRGLVPGRYVVQFHGARGPLPPANGVRQTVEVVEGEDAVATLELLATAPPK